jgi:hypothetical protein
MSDIVVFLAGYTATLRSRFSLTGNLLCFTCGHRFTKLTRWEKGNQEVWICDQCSDAHAATIEVLDGDPC